MTDPATHAATSPHPAFTTRLASVQTQVVELPAEPGQSQQLDGPIGLFWEPAARAGQPRRGLACTFSVCKLPSCSCRDVEVQVQLVDDRIFGIRNEGGDLTSILRDRDTVDPTPTAWAKLALDLDVGDFRLHTAGTILAHTPHGGFKPSTGPSVADVANFVGDLFKRHAGSALLERLRTRGRVLKGVTEGWKAFDWSWFQRGDLVGWSDAFPKAADGLVWAGERWLQPLDFYCVEAGCTCDEVKIELFDMSADRERLARLVGVIEVALSTGIARQFRPAAGMSRLLRAGWRAYSEAEPLDRLLPDRAKRMKEVGSFLLARRPSAVPSVTAVSLPPPLVATGSAVARERPGPNQPCPCGSGLKFKRCCMRR